MPLPLVAIPAWAWITGGVIAGGAGAVAVANATDDAETTVSGDQIVHNNQGITVKEIAIVGGAGAAVYFYQKGNKAAAAGMAALSVVTWWQKKAS